MDGGQVIEQTEQQVSLHNLALGKPATQSSISSWSRERTTTADAQRGNDGNFSVEYGFHTGTEPSPWWQVDLEEVFNVSEVRLYNRKGLGSRLRYFTILTSLDGAIWRVFLRKNDSSVFGDDDNLPFVAAAEPQVARFVRVRSDSTTCLHLVECEVYGVKPAADELKVMLLERAKLAYQDAFAEALRVAKLAKLGSADVEALKMACVTVLEGADQLRKIKRQADAVSDAVAQAVTMLYGKDHILGPHGIRRGIEAEPLERKALLLSTIENFFRLMKQEMSIECCFVAGSLLGFVREGGFLKHDDDYDATYISNETAAINIIMERWDIFTHVKKMEGFTIADITGGHFHVTSTSGERFLFDLFTSWNEGGMLCQYPISPRRPAISNILPTKTISIYGTPVTVPNTPERLLEVNYGDSWRIPDPTATFDWTKLSDTYEFLYCTKFDRSLNSIIGACLQRSKMISGLPLVGPDEIPALLSADLFSGQGTFEDVLNDNENSGIIVLDLAAADTQTAQLARAIEERGICLRFLSRIDHGQVAARIFPSYQAMLEERREIASLTP